MNTISKITDYLYLGNEYDARTLHVLLGRGITHILNVADDVPNYHPDVFVYCNLDVKDFGQDPGIIRVFPTAYEFVRGIDRTNSEKVFVHCAAGINRSATVTIALMMMIENQTLKEAVVFVKQRRKAIRPQNDNVENLIMFELDYLKANSLGNVEEFYTHMRSAIQPKKKITEQAQDEEIKSEQH